MENLDLIYEYQQLLLGRYKTFPSYCFSNKEETADRDEKNAIILLKYAVEEILRWTPMQMYELFDGETIKALKLERIVKHIRMEPEIRKDDYFAYAHKLYPKIISLDRRALTLNTYQLILTGKLGKVPKGFFEDSLGATRAKICLNYVLTHYMNFKSTKDMYEAFLPLSGGAIMKKFHLQTAVYFAWKQPIDFLHDSLSEEDKNEAWYHYYKLLSKFAL